MDFEKVNKRIKELETLIQKKKVKKFEPPLYTGIDLGTASIVLCVVDKSGKAVAGAMQRSGVVRDGVVVDYSGAVSIVRKLKEQLEQRLGTQLHKAAVAIPPGVEQHSMNALVHIAEACNFEINVVTDEPTAASRVLDIQEGAVVDVGGGTTGISVLQDGKVTFTADEPTGGHHMTLVLSGNRKIPYEEAEDLKMDPAKEREVFPIIRPVVEKMAEIVRRNIQGREVQELYMVGGASTFTDFEAVFQKETKIPTYKPYAPMYITPLGIALSSMEAEERKNP